jgi:ribosomal protein S18 acetylase RimI-like enzyme
VKILLRNYRESDFDAIHRIDQACYSSDTAYSRSELRTYLAFLGAECIVAEIKMKTGPAMVDARGPRSMELKMVGFCISGRSGDRGHIITMDVLEEFRKHGIGSTLLRAIEKRLAAAGVQRIGLETAIDNQVAIGFWQKHGYVSVGIKKGYYPGGRDAFYMTKAVGPLPAPEPAEAKSQGVTRQARTTRRKSSRKHPRKN